MADEVEWSDGRIVARGRLDQGDIIRRFAAGLHQTIVESRHTEITLDFVNCEIATEAVMLPLLPLIAHHRQQSNISFDLQLPTSGDLYRLFLDTNWAHFIDPEHFEANIESFGHVPARQFQTQESIWTASKAVLNFVHRSISLHRDVIAAVEWSLNEIMDNVLTHSESLVGGFVQATAYQNRVEFVVADAGIGIPNSLGVRNHAEALERSVSEGVTRDADLNQGNGLFGSYQLAAGSDGQFEIHSLAGQLVFDRVSQAPVSRSQQVPYQGTSVRCGIGTQDTEAVNRAFAFGGKPHAPAFDFIESTFESDSGEIVFRIADHARADLGTRAGGRRVRQQLENLLNDADRVWIDFEGIDVITSSFADEVFGRLFVALGPRSFMTRVLLRHVHPRIDGLIDRAIILRTRNGGKPLT